LITGKAHLDKLKKENKKLRTKAKTFATSTHSLSIQNGTELAERETGGEEDEPTKGEAQYETSIKQGQK
jgi:predicted ATPase